MSKAEHMEIQSYSKVRYVFSSKREIVWREICAYLKKNLWVGDNVLDIGCGYGDFINNINAPQRSALDLNPLMKSHISPEVVFKNGSIENITAMFASKFDTIFSSNLLEHLTRDQIDKLLDDAHSLLNEKGRLILLIPNYRRCSQNYFDDYTHLTPLSDVGLSDWITAKGYTLIFKHPGFMPFSMKDSKLPIFSFLVRMWIYSPWKPSGKQMLLVAEKNSAKK